MSSQDNSTSNPAEVTRIGAFIGLGSNQTSQFGSPRETLLAAMQRLADWSSQPVLRSSLWESEPLDCPPGSPPFINAVVGMLPAVEETPHSLLARLLDLEQQFGRQRGNIVNAPRTLDLDLICFGNRRVADERLTLPHPAAWQRGFVLLPLAEVAPQLRLPGQAQTVAELAAAPDLHGQLVVKIDD